MFADEAGNFDFSRKRGASHYFVLCTVTSTDLQYGNALLDLRRRLAWDGHALNGPLHATTDKQAVRDEVYALLGSFDLRVDATVLEKPKTQPHLQTEERFYKMAWYLHFKYVAPRVSAQQDRLLVAAASIGTKKKQSSFRSALQDVVNQMSPSQSNQVAFWPMESDPCIWAADYATWAIQRMYESGDDRSYRLIEHQVKSNFPAWARGDTTYY